MSDAVLSARVAHRLALVIAALLLVSAVSACSGDDSHPAAPASSSTTSNEGAVRQQILTTYNGWSQASFDAGVKPDPNSAKLARWAADPLLSQTRKGLQELLDQGVALRGKPSWTVRITSLSLDASPPSASLLGCLDTSHVTTVDRTTGKPNDTSSPGLEKYRSVARAEERSGRWYIVRDDPEPTTPC